MTEFHGGFRSLLVAIPEEMILFKDHPKGGCCNQVLHLAQGHMCETSVLHRAIGFAAAVRKAAAFGFRRFEGDYPRMGPCAQNNRQM